MEGFETLPPILPHLQVKGMKKLKGKVALITGGTTGIGLASARLFRDEGARVIVTGTRLPGIEALAMEDGIEAVRSDQSCPADIAALASAIGKRHGRLDIMFLNAGIPGKGQPLGAVDEATCDDIIGINLKGVLFTAQALLPLMAKGGAIIITSSVAAHSALPGASVYAASKAGVRAFVRSWAAELLPRGIRVNTLTPGLIETPLMRRIDVTPEAMERLASKIVPMGRAGTPLEAAAAALFLASNDSSFITGGEIIVSGGQIDL